MRAASRIALPVVLAAAIGMSGCSSTSSEAGFGLPTLSPGDAAEVLADARTEPIELTGTLVVEPNGCFAVAGLAADAAWIVWPDTARQRGDVVRLASGVELGAGSSLTASGALVDLADLPGGARSSSYFGSFGRFCHADERRIAVFAAVGS